MSDESALRTTKTSAARGVRYLLRASILGIGLLLCAPALADAVPQGTGIELSPDERGWTPDPDPTTGVTRLYPAHPPSAAQIDTHPARSPCVRAAAAKARSAETVTDRRHERCHRGMKQRLFIGAIVMWYAVGLLLAVALIMRGRPRD